MNFLSPPMYNVTNIDMWKFKLTAYLKSLGLHVYLATTRKSYLGNDKHIEANAHALVALKHTLSKDQFSMISHYDFAFAVWNTLMAHVLEKELVEMSPTKYASWSKEMTPLR